MPPHCLLMDESDNSTNNVKVSSADGSTGSGSTGAFDCIRPHFNDIMDFLADVHTLSKLKSNSRAMSPGPGLDEDTLGGTVKAGMAQLLALEIVRGNGKDNKCLQRYMPWLLNPPSSIQQGYDCIDTFHWNNSLKKNNLQATGVSRMRLSCEAVVLVVIRCIATYSSGDSHSFEWTLIHAK